MSISEELGNRKDFYSHLLVFIVVHVLVFILLRVDDDSFPSFLSRMLQSITEGKIWFYHEPSGIFVGFVWLFILFVQGIYVFFIKSKNAD